MIFISLDYLRDINANAKLRCQDEWDAPTCYIAARADLNIPVQDIGDWAQEAGPNFHSSLDGANVVTDTRGGRWYFLGVSWWNQGPICEPCWQKQVKDGIFMTHTNCPGGEFCDGSEDTKNG